MGRREKRRRPPAEKQRGSSVEDDGNIREELLASLIAGTLAPVQRAEVASYLAGSADARETFLMAYHALISGRERRGV